jgi:hypothetical protein
MTVIGLNLSEQSLVLARAAAAQESSFHDNSFQHTCDNFLVEASVPLEQLFRNSGLPLVQIDEQPFPKKKNHWFYELV